MLIGTYSVVPTVRLSQPAGRTAVEAAREDIRQDGGLIVPACEVDLGDSLSRRSIQYG